LLASSPAGELAGVVVPRRFPMPPPNFGVEIRDGNSRPPVLCIGIAPLAEPIAAPTLPPSSLLGIGMLGGGLGVAAGLGGGFVGGRCRRADGASRFRSVRWGCGAVGSRRGLEPGRVSSHKGERVRVELKVEGEGASEGPATPPPHY